MKKTIFQIIVLILLSFILGSVTLAIHPNSKNIYFFKPKVENKMRMSVEEFVKLDKDEYLLLDARTEEDYNDYHIPSAIHFKFEDLNSDKIEILLPYTNDSSKKIITYCSSDLCDLSKLLANGIKDQVGKQEVFILSDGLKAWNEWHNK